MSAENKINHQFLNLKFFLYNGEIHTLVLSRLNPSNLYWGSTEYFKLFT
jgi:hypothetical protein